MAQLQNSFDWCEAIPFEMKVSTLNVELIHKLDVNNIGPRYFLTIT